MGDKMKSNDLVMEDLSKVYVIKRRLYFIIKRLFDICCSLVGMLILIPLTIIVKICYICTGDFGSIFYRQERLGKNGQIIRIFKYRTMVKNADKILAYWLENNPDKREEYLRERKIDNDPRITKLGKFLRVASIDEFPQFINVFVGDMSLIGPRPVVPDEAENYKKNKDKFLSVRPGLTGYWASSGRNNISYDERMNMELYYVEHCSITFDIKIIWKTIIAVIKKEGAK